jgi:hypothetical protein
MKLSTTTTTTVTTAKRTATTTTTTGRECNNDDVHQILKFISIQNNFCISKDNMQVRTELSTPITFNSAN